MGPLYEDDDLAPDPELISEEAGLRELEARIDKLKEPAGGDNKLFARGVALVTSMGFILAGCLIGGFFLGDYVADRTGYQAFQFLGLLLGLAAAVFALIKLMRPFLKSAD